MDAREFRHAVRNHFNNMKLSSLALEWTADPEERLVFINAIIRSADELAELLDQPETREEPAQ